MNDDPIQRVLCEYGGEHRLRDDRAIETHRGFSGAVVFRVATDAGEFALRRSSIDALPLERIRGLHRLLRWVFDAGVTQVPVPVASTGGSTIVSTENACWQLEPWMPGVADFHDTPSRERLRSAMKTLAAWHRAAARFAPRDEEREWFRSEPESPSPAVGERLAKLNRWMSGRFHRLREAHASHPHDEFAEVAADVLRLFPEIAPPVAADLRKLATRSYRLQPCLRDVWHDHLLFTGDAVTGLIDETACRTENVATDLARLIGSLVEDDPGLRTTALDAYQQFHPLEPAEWELMRTLDKSGVLLGGLYWLDRRYLRQSAFADERAVIERLRGMVRRQKSM